MPSTVEELSYRVYGGLLCVSGNCGSGAEPQKTSRTFTGHQNDAEAGLLYMGARYYDPATAPDGREFNLPVAAAVGNKAVFAVAMAYQAYGAGQAASEGRMFTAMTSIGEPPRFLRRHG